MAEATPIPLSDGASTGYEESVTDRSFDSIDELLSRFTLDFQPEYVLKIRNRYDSLLSKICFDHFYDYPSLANFAPFVLVGWGPLLSE